MFFLTQFLSVSNEHLIYYECCWLKRRNVGAERHYRSPHHTLKSLTEVYMINKRATHLCLCQRCAMALRS